MGTGRVNGGGHERKGKNDKDDKIFEAEREMNKNGEQKMKG